MRVWHGVGPFVTELCAERTSSHVSLGVYVCYTHVCYMCVCVCVCVCVYTHGSTKLPGLALLRRRLAPDCFKGPYVYIH